MSDFVIEELIDKMARCEFLYFTYIFRIIFGILALIIVTIILLLPIGLSIILCLFVDAKCGAGSFCCNIIFILLEYFYFDFIITVYVKTTKFFFVLHC